jgi:hypothetical protein
LVACRSPSRSERSRPPQIATALAAGLLRAEDYLRRGLIAGAAIALQSQTAIVGGPARRSP